MYNVLYTYFFVASVLEAQIMQAYEKVKRFIFKDGQYQNILLSERMSSWPISLMIFTIKGTKKALPQIRFVFCQSSQQFVARKFLVTEKVWKVMDPHSINVEFVKSDTCKISEDSGKIFKKKTQKIHFLCICVCR